MTSTIYKATNKINGKCYTGFDSNWPNRMIRHKHQYKSGNRKFYDAIKKYGWDNFLWEVVYQSKDKEHTLTVMEPYFIKEFDSFNNGYNMTEGGEGTFGFTPWNKNKSDIYTEISLEKMRIAKIGIYVGEKNPNFGKKTTPEKKSNISKGRLNTPKITCIHCDMVGDPGIMTRWHFDNCRYRTAA